MLSLTSGAILLIAAFLHDAPKMAGAKWLVLASLTLFFIAFWAFLVTLADLSKYFERGVVEIKSDEPASERQAKGLKTMGALADDINTWEHIGRICFFFAMMLMFIMAFLTIWNW